MTCAIASSFACLPVTALQTAAVGELDLLLVGQGSFLKAYNSEGLLLWQKRVFKSENLHGFATRNRNTGTPTDEAFTVLVYGTSKACFVRLKPWYENGSSVTSRVQPVLGPVIDVADWILCGAFIPSDSGHPDEACVITAHNVLFRLSGSASGEKDVLVSRMARGPTSILYSAYLKPLSSRHIIVAAGTVFGEIYVWSCHKTLSHSTWTCNPHYSFTGHRGSIFGVCISEEVITERSRRRFLASCSDDRTIRVWDITEFSLDLGPAVHEKSLTAPSTSTTGFVEGTLGHGGTEMTVVWAHLSRIWNVSFLPSPDGLPQKILASQGEDAMCQIWTISEDLHELSHEAVKLSALQSDRHHAGKNIWSMAFDEAHIFTGGADGSVIYRPFTGDRPQDEVRSKFAYTVPFEQVFSQCLQANTSVAAHTPLPRAIKQYALIGTETILATTESGHLLQGALGNHEFLTSWKLLYVAPRILPLGLCTSPSLSVAFAAEETKIMAIVLADENASLSILQLHYSLDAEITWMHVAWASRRMNSATSEFCLAVSVRLPSRMRIIWVAVGESLRLLQDTEVELPATFTPTSAMYDPRLCILILGSRAGAVALYSNVDRWNKSARTPYCVRHVHGTDAVTSITPLDEPSRPVDERQDALHVLTTGRDGAYAVHEIGLSGVEPHKQLSFESIHVSSPPFGPNIEGAYLAVNEKDSFQTELILYGFRSKDFVVWNESSQAEVFSVECGGAHRSWSYSPMANKLTGAGTSSGGKFIWTKAGSVHVFSRREPRHCVVQQGGHGREIKAMAKPSGRYSDHNRGRRDGTLIATGAEDTTIRLFIIPDAGTSDGKFQCVRVLNRHTTGLQHLQFSKCGKYLFSSAGCEEFFVWKLRSNISCIEIGAVLQDSLPKEEADSDSRITSFDVKDHGGHAFLIAAAYSNGKIKVFRYTCSVVGAGTFEILAQVVEGQFCLTQVRFSDVDSGVVDLLTAGTNGYLNITRTTLSDTLAPLVHSQRTQIHQSSVKSMQIVTLTNNLRLIFTGGDDNALGLTISQATVGLVGGEFKTQNHTLLISNAHAAAITALSVLRLTHHSDIAEVLLASTGNDQRVIVWRVAIGKTVKVQPYWTGLLDLEHLHVDKIGEAWTNVADVGDMELITGAVSDTDLTMGCEVLVIGVGMEMLRIDF